MTSGAFLHPDSVGDRQRRGVEARATVPWDAHAVVGSPEGRDAVRVLLDQESSRLPDLLPIRHERMLASPFAFFRGAAAVMAGDLGCETSTGFHVQLCGDAHLSNFGIFGSPERRLVFDVTDFDETLPGPWEWDLKRLAASLAVAGRENAYDEQTIGKIVRSAVRRYQKAIVALAGLSNLEAWHAHVDMEDARSFASQGARTTARLETALRKARSRDHLRSLGKLTTLVDGERRFVADPPVLVPLADLAPEQSRREMAEDVEGILLDYAGKLAAGPRQLLGTYRFVDVARKVVGVGSVGSRCWVVLLLGRDQDDPLFLQVKEAQPSALAPHLEPGGHRDEGVRVVEGQRVMQAASDVFLGAQRVTGHDGRRRDFYVRQLHNWKGSARVAAMEPEAMRAYGRLCGATLARAHARSGDRIAIASYLGSSDGFARAVVAFASAYADRNEDDFARFGRALATGDLSTPGRTATGA
jgi:uncharacterized protein (DUF2252 family)